MGGTDENLSELFDLREAGSVGGKSGCALNDTVRRLRRSDPLRVDVPARLLKKHFQYESAKLQIPWLSSELVTFQFRCSLWPESFEEHLPTGIAGVPSATLWLFD